MRPLKPDAYALLNLVVILSPYTKYAVQQARLRDVQKHKRALVRQGLLKITGEDGQWERLWATEGGKLMLEWQRPLVAQQHTPQVVNIYKIPKTWETDSSYTYVGRAGKGKTGYFGNPVVPEEGQEPGSTLGAYEAYLRGRIESDPQFKARVKALVGKKLVCFCKPRPCHGDILAVVCGELNA